MRGGKRHSTVDLARLQRYPNAYQAAQHLDQTTDREKPNPKAEKTNEAANWRRMWRRSTGELVGYDSYVRVLAAREARVQLLPTLLLRQVDVSVQRN